MDLLFEILIYLAFFAAGYFYRHMLLMRDLVNIVIPAAKKKSESVVEIELTLHQLTHEIINDQHYFYAVNDNSFVCQAADLAEAAKKYLTATSPSNIGWFEHCTSKKRYFFANGELQELENE
jgi:hypothetical protein